MIYLIFFILGASLGSFINVIYMRFSPRRSLFKNNKILGRSRCDSCKKDLAWFELIPFLSYIFLLGRCRRCKKIIPIRHFIMEAVVGMIAVLVPLKLNSFLGMNEGLFQALALSPFYYAFIVVWILVITVWVLIVTIDIKHYIIPDELNISLVVLGGILLFLKSRFNSFLAMRESFLGSFADLFTLTKSMPVNILLGALAGGLFFALLVYLSRGRAMGLGDVKLGLASGFVIGYPDMILAVLLSFIIGGVVGLVLLMAGRRRFGDVLPFAPFLGLGFVLVFFFGQDIVAAYFSVFPMLY